MSDRPAPSSHAAIPPPQPDEHRPAGMPGPLLADRSRSLHDRQRELVRASLLACSPGEAATGDRRA
jgi:hypothetical protein